MIAHFLSSDQGRRLAYEHVTWALPDTPRSCVFLMTAARNEG